MISSVIHERSELIGVHLAQHRTPTTAGPLNKVAVTHKRLGIKPATHFAG